MVSTTLTSSDYVNVVPPSAIPLPNNTVSISPSYTTSLNSSDYGNESEIIDNTQNLVDKNPTFVSQIMVYKNQIMIGVLVFFIIMIGSYSIV